MVSASLGTHTHTHKVATTHISSSKRPGERSTLNIDESGWVLLFKSQHRDSEALTPFPNAYLDMLWVTSAPPVIQATCCRGECLKGKTTSLRASICCDAAMQAESSPISGRVWRIRPIARHVSCNQGPRKRAQKGTRRLRMM